MKPIKFRVDIAIYRTQVDVLVTDEIEWAGKKYRLDVSGHWKAKCYCKPGACFIFLRPSMINIGSVMHESIHAANHILSSVGVLADHDNDEAQVYLATYIFEEIVRRIYENPTPKQQKQ